METSIIPSLTELPPVVSTAVIRPHSASATFTCVTCHKPCAHWRIRHPRYGREDADICALCFLYTSGWLVTERQRRVQQVIQVISLKRQKTLEMDSGDQQSPPRLAQVADADSVLGAIVLHDRYEWIEHLKRRRPS